MIEKGERIQTLASGLFMRRLGALLIDMGLCFGLLALFEAFAGNEEIFATERSDLTKNILFSVFIFLSHLLFRGKTLGKLITGLRVVSTDTSRAGAFPLIYREFLGRFLIEKSNLILCYVLNTTGTLERWRAMMPHPLLDTALVALVNLPWLTFVSCAFALCRPDGRTLHDLVSGTMVMRD